MRDEEGWNAFAAILERRLKEHLERAEIVLFPPGTLKPGMDVAKHVESAGALDPETGVVTLRGSLRFEIRIPLQ